jgi:hypothetical protein
MAIKSVCQLYYSSCSYNVCLTKATTPHLSAERESSRTRRDSSQERGIFRPAAAGPAHKGGSGAPALGPREEGALAQVVVQSTRLKIFMY